TLAKCWQRVLVDAPYCAGRTSMCTARTRAPGDNVYSPYLDPLLPTEHPSPSVSQRGRNVAARSLLGRTDTCRFRCARDARHPHFLARLRSRGGQGSHRADTYLPDGIPPARLPRITRLDACAPDEPGHRASTDD